MRFLEAYILVKREEEELLLLDLVVQGSNVCCHQELHPEDEAQIHSVEMRNAAIPSAMV